jgi:hypothetical protein
MTSIIVVVQIAAVSTVAILVGICLVCSCKKSTLLKRRRVTSSSGKPRLGTEGKVTVNPRASCRSGLIFSQNQKR